METQVLLKEFSGHLTAPHLQPRGQGRRIQWSVVQMDEDPHHCNATHSFPLKFTEPQL